MSGIKLVHGSAEMWLCVNSTKRLYKGEIVPTALCGARGSDLKNEKYREQKGKSSSDEAIAKFGEYGTNRDSSE